MRYFLDVYKRQVVEKKEIEESLYEILAHFKDELKPDKLTVQEDLALISTVGKNMSDKPGTSGKLFGALGKNNINIVMIAQGSDEINITVGVKKKDLDVYKRQCHTQSILR